MMYPYITLDDNTEITHSEIKEDNVIKVYIETPDEKIGFKNAVCFLPNYNWVDILGYSEDEITFFDKLLQNNAHLIYECAQN